MKRVALVVLLFGLLAGTAASATPAKITVYAASSLTNVFPKITDESYSFGGSNSLAAQIEQGAPADVFASANMKLPAKLYHESLCSKPVEFTRNRLVVIVPTANPAHIKGIFGLTKPGVKVDIAAAGVPVGDFTRQILTKLGIAKKVMANVVSQETDVREVLSKVALGEVDAGFVYATDAKTVSDQVKVIAVPARAQPKVRYGICVVSSSSHKADAKAFIARVLSPSGQKTLRAYGFLPR
jgi:molybdate transport system substrate-binding protein